MVEQGIRNLKVVLKGQILIYKKCSLQEEKISTIMQFMLSW